ncbi:MAG: Fe-S cluster assembly protein SufB, partial [Bacteroidales bacterium]
MIDENTTIHETISNEYQYGFTSNIQSETIPKGLTQDTVRLISAKKNEPQWLLDFRLKAFAQWQSMKMPTWAHLNIPHIDYQDIIYYSAPKPTVLKESMDEVDPELRATFD